MHLRVRQCTFLETPLRMVLSRLVGDDLDLVPLQAGVELEAGEAEQGGRPRLVAMGALERVEDGLPLELLQGAGGRGGGWGLRLCGRLGGDRLGQGRPLQGPPLPRPPGWQPRRARIYRARLAHHEDLDFLAGRLRCPQSLRDFRLDSLPVLLLGPVGNPPLSLSQSHCFHGQPPRTFTL